MEIGTIYRITNEINGFVYIGSTIHQKSRLAKHLRHLRKNKHRNKLLQEEFNKFGEFSFNFEILHVNISEHLLHLYEMSEIAAADYNGPGVYNIGKASRISPSKRMMLTERRQTTAKERYR